MGSEMCIRDRSWAGVCITHSAVAVFQTMYQTVPPLQCSQTPGDATAVGIPGSVDLNTVPVLVLMSMSALTVGTVLTRNNNELSPHSQRSVKDFFPTETS